MRGRRSDAAHLKILHGRGDGRDSGGRQITQIPFERQAPRKPTGLSKAASKHWDQVVPELERVGALTPAHVGALTALVQSWGRMVDAQRLIDEEGLLAINSQGRVRHPAVAVLEAAQREYRSWCIEFGLTPASESKAGTAWRPDEEDNNPFS